jgi:hypothetical protein
LLTMVVLDGEKSRWYNFHYINTGWLIRKAEGGCFHDEEVAAVILCFSKWQNRVIRRRENQVV